MTEQLEITIDTSALEDLTGRAPLFESSSTGESYRAYLLLDEEGDVYVDTRAPWDNATPIEEWLGRTLKWEVPAAVQGDDLRETIRTENFAELMQRVYDGHSIVWNGNNAVGILDDDAEEASEELEQLLSNLNVWDVWDADDFLSEAHIQGLWPTEMSLHQVVNDIEQDAAEQKILLPGGSDAIERILCEKLLNQLEDKDSFELSEEQRKALQEHDAVALANIEAARAE